MTIDNFGCDEKAETQIFQAFPGEDIVHAAKIQSLPEVYWRAARFCDPYLAASNSGSYVFPPFSFHVRIIAGDLAVRLPEHPEYAAWIALDKPFLPKHIAQHVASKQGSAEAICPPVLCRLRESRVLQIWSGLIARTPAGQALLVRPLVNTFNDLGYRAMEGVIQTDWWYGPVINNIVIRNDVDEIFIDKTIPLFQLQTVPLNASAHRFHRDINYCDWRRFRQLLHHTQACKRSGEGLGPYARQARRHRAPLQK